jgi:hypothetical protein
MTTRAAGADRQRIHRRVGGPSDRRGVGRASGAFNPSGHGLKLVPTDPAGRVRLRLPPGDAQVFVRAMPTGYARPSNQWDQRKVTVGQDRFLETA